jgi:acetylornithine deacetylase/succinyl-diaminopimelate desuccinylase-like protein
MSRLPDVLAAVDQGLDASLARLMDILRVPSISADPAYKADCRRAAEWTVAELAGIGFEAKLAETAGHPVVVAHHRPANAKRHVLFYGHYDVQPPDPLDLWTSAPFEPQIVDGPRGKRIVARGASDDKGQFLTFVEAARAWMAVNGELPIAVTVMVEGEEECGSLSLPGFFAKHGDEVRAEIALVCDTNQWNETTPGITTTLRGMLYEEVIVTAPNRDLHSGLYGGPALNPINALTRALAALHDDNNSVTVPGFYDGVPDLPADVRANWDALNFNVAGFLGAVGLAHPAGEKDRTALEQLWSRPTCDINGIVGGYIGEGSKTVIASKASAKVSFRLVGTQNPEAIRDSFRAFIRSKLPEDAKVEFRNFACAPAQQQPLDGKDLRASAQALKDEWGQDTALMGCGASIPIVADFKHELGMDTLLIGFALEDDAIHSPNEKYEVSAYHRGIRSWARILEALSKA